MMLITIGRRALLAALIAVFTIAASTTNPPPLQALVGAVLRSGPDGRIPANLSLVLGLASPARPVGVKQAVVREGSVVKTFNVSTERNADVVLMSYDEQTRSMYAYLTSASGVLRKAVAYAAGGQAAERPKKDAAKDFEIEVQRWSSLAQKSAGR